MHGRFIAVDLGKLVQGMEGFGQHLRRPLTEHAPFSSFEFSVCVHVRM